MSYLLIHEPGLEFVEVHQLDHQRVSVASLCIHATDWTAMIDRGARALGGYHAEDGYTDEDWQAAGDAYDLRQKAERVLIAAFGGV